MLKEQLTNIVEIELDILTNLYDELTTNQKLHILELIRLKRAIETSKPLDKSYLQAISKLLEHLMKRRKTLEDFTEKENQK